jgi:hypothetical protein
MPVAIMKMNRSVSGPAAMSRTLYGAMTDNSMLTPPRGPASPSTGQTRPGPQGPALLTAVLIAVGSVVIGLAAGAIWAAVAPRVLYQVESLTPPTAFATNPETSAFIAADGWYCFIALAGGALIGLLGYLFGVRRYGPAPMAGIVVGSIAAAFISAWLGHLISGGAGFDHVLATSRLYAFLHAPISLGSHGALAFWPLAAAGVAGGIELVGVLRTRHQALYEAMPMPGMETFGSGSPQARPYPGGPHLSQPHPSQPQPGQHSNGQPSAAHRQDAHRAPGGSETQNGDPGRGGP